MRRSVLVTVSLLLVAFGLLLLGAAKVAGDVNAATGNVRAVFGILGMPIVIGLKEAGRRRLEFGWGTLVIFVAPFLIGQIWAIWHVMNRRPTLS